MSYPIWSLPTRRSETIGVGYVIIAIAIGSWASFSGSIAVAVIYTLSYGFDIPGLHHGLSPLIGLTAGAWFLGPIIFMVLISPALWIAAKHGVMGWGFMLLIGVVGSVFWRMFQILTDYQILIVDGISGGHLTSWLSGDLPASAILALVIWGILRVMKPNAFKAAAGIPG